MGYLADYISAGILPGDLHASSSFGLEGNLGRKASDGRICCTSSAGMQSVRVEYDIPLSIPIPHFEHSKILYLHYLLMLVLSHRLTKHRQANTNTQTRTRSSSQYIRPTKQAKVIPSPPTSPLPAFADPPRTNSPKCPEPIVHVPSAKMPPPPLIPPGQYQYRGATESSLVHPARHMRGAS